MRARETDEIRSYYWPAVARELADFSKADKKHRRRQPISHVGIIIRMTCDWFRCARITCDWDFTLTTRMGQFFGGFAISNRFVRRISRYISRGSSQHWTHPFIRDRKGFGVVVDIAVLHRHNGTIKRGSDNITYNPLEVRRICRIYIIYAGCAHAYAVA